jgi:hypothetical protein
MFIKTKLHKIPYFVACPNQPMILAGTSKKTFGLKFRTAA